MSELLIVAPRYNPSLLTMLAQRLEGIAGIRLIEDRRIPKKNRRARPYMCEGPDRRRQERRDTYRFRFHGAVL